MGHLLVGGFNATTAVIVVYHTINKRIAQHGRSRRVLEWVRRKGGKERETRQENGDNSADYSHCLPPRWNPSVSFPPALTCTSTIYQSKGQPHVSIKSEWHPTIRLIILSTLANSDIPRYPRISCARRLTSRFQASAQPFLLPSVDSNSLPPSPHVFLLVNDLSSGK